ncbi:hypothetical protein BGX38DRAFT_1210685, partial [Terfezia claveryi]
YSMIYLYLLPLTFPPTPSYYNHYAVYISNTSFHIPPSSRFSFLSKKPLHQILRHLNPTRPRHLQHGVQLFPILPPTHHHAFPHTLLLQQPQVMFHSIIPLLRKELAKDFTVRLH